MFLVTYFTSSFNGGPKPLCFDPLITHLPKFSRYYFIHKNVEEKGKDNPLQIFWGYRYRGIKRILKVLYSFILCLK